MEKSGLMWLIGTLLLLWLVIGSYLLRNHFCGDQEATVTEEVIEPTKVIGFSAEDGTFKTSADSYFRFPEASATYEGISDNLRNSLSETATYLKDNTNKVLTITGYYSEEEDKPDLLPNYGFARANTIKEELESLGVDASQITTDGEIANETNFQDGYFTNGVSFTFSEKAEDGTDTRLERIRENIVGNALTLYFDSGDQTLNLSTNQKEDFADMIYFLDRVEDSSLEIGGHTDSQGEEKYNQRLSRKRAEFVRDYVSAGGVSTSRMSAVGYGEDKPIDDNKYEAGREKNRRVEIILKES